MRFGLNKLSLASVGAMAVFGLGCEKNVTPPAADLTVWGLWQESSDIEPVIQAYEEQFGGHINYKKMAAVATYEQELREAQATGRGPDVFVVHHTWVEGKRELMTPAPADVIKPGDVSAEFVPVVTTDVVRDNQVWALPTSVDSLALYYNMDDLKGAGVEVPTNWTEFQNAVGKLTKVNQVASVLHSGAALGSAANVNRAADIVQLLMLQSGVEFKTKDSSRVTLTGEEAKRSLTFYTDFANSKKATYSWNLEQASSLEAFAAGFTSMMLNYSYHLPTVRALNPALSFAVAPLPQIAGSTLDSQMTFASYWPFAVSAASENRESAWHFIRYITNAESAAEINKAQAVPPARLDNVVQSSGDPFIDVFAIQSPQAKSWPRESINLSDKVFGEMIDSVVRGEATVDDALQQAEGLINSFP